MRKYFLFSTKAYFKIFYFIFTSAKVHFILQGLSEKPDLTTRVPKNVNRLKTTLAFIHFTIITK
jgi:hypothetical protein